MISGLTSVLLVVVMQ